MLHTCNLLYIGCTLINRKNACFAFWLWRGSFSLYDISNGLKSANHCHRAITTSKQSDISLSSFMYVWVGVPMYRCKCMRVQVCLGMWSGWILICHFVFCLCPALSLWTSSYITKQSLKTWFFSVWTCLHLTNCSPMVELSVSL